ncbi:Hypothetical protein NTJ_09778 [Nesidiocoris tenuis]|uniref:Odorant receptor n=1 Tax=Nesidiocoris tenuis TaxID=355587 RepID=A0ABN7AZH8_9HEMI|nr:Hypothetical protein NTJ_09778 [Nesidiocoris tenuis]
MSDLDELILVSQLTGIYFEFPGFRKEGLLAKLQKIRAALVVGLACASLWVMGLQGVESIMGLESSQAVMGLLTAFHVVFLYKKRTLLGDVIESIKNLRYNFRVFNEEEFQRRMGPIRKVARVYQISMFIYTMFYTVIPRLFDLTIGTPLWSHRLPAAIASIVNREGQTRDAQYVFATLGAVVYVPLTANAYSGVMSCLVLFGFYYSNLVDGFSKRLEEFDADFE